MKHFLLRTKIYFSLMFVDESFFFNSDYYDHALGGLVIEAHVHGLPTPNVKFYRDGHLIHARNNKVVFFLEDKEIFQCLMVRPDASVSGTYTVLAENKAGKKRFDHHVDFVTKYPLIHLPGMRHADKKLDDFVELMLEKIPKQPEEPKPTTEADAKPAEVQTEEVKAIPAEAEKGEKDVAEKETVKDDQPKTEVSEAPKAEEIAEALQAVIDPDAPKPEGEEVKPVEKPKKHKSKSKSKHRKKERKASPKIDDDLVDDGEEPETELEPSQEEKKRKFSTVPHEPYEEETFRIYNAKNNLWFSGNLRDQTAIEGSTIKLLCAVTGPMPIMKWLKNGKPISWGQNMRNMTGEGLGHVLIEKIARADAGVYSCTAKNSFNEVTTEAVIKVIQKSTVPKTDTYKPAFTRVLGEFYHTVEDDLILDAHVRSIPEPKIIWFKDGIELSKAMDDRYDFTDDHDGGYQFRIHKPKVEDSALYACEAVNSEGKAKVTHKVIFTELERHTHPQFVYHKESLWQPTLRMSIEPEPVKEPSPVYEYISKIKAPRVLEEVAAALEEVAIMEEVAALEVTELAGSSAGEANVPSSQGSGDSGNQGSAENGDASTGGAPTGSSGTGGDGNEEGEDGNDGKDKPNDAPEDAEDEEKQEKKTEKRSKSSRRKRYEGPVEPLLIRDSVIKF